MRLSEITEGYWKNIDINRQESDPAKPTVKDKRFCVMINGKIWLKNGKPVDFPSKDLATRAADTIRQKYNKVTQVIPKT